MTEESVVRIAAMVKVSILAGMRSALKRGDSVEQILDRYEYSTFAFKDDELVLITVRHDAPKNSEDLEKRA